MLTSLLIAIGGIVSLMICWVLVQNLWKRTFSDHVVDNDALAGRSSCSNCGCNSICEHKSSQIKTATIIKK